MNKSITNEQLAKILAITSVYIFNRQAKGNLEKLRGIKISQIIQEGYDTCMTTINEQNFVEDILKDYDKVMSGEMDIDNIMRTNETKLN